MNTTNPAPQGQNPANQKFDRLSPVVELTLILLVKMREYLEIYAKDIQATDLDQYNKALKALEGAIESIAPIFGLKMDDLLVTKQLEKLNAKLQNMQPQQPATSPTATQPAPMAPTVQAPVAPTAPQAPVAPETPETTMPTTQEQVSQTQTHAMPEEPTAPEAPQAPETSTEEPTSEPAQPAEAETQGSSETDLSALLQELEQNVGNPNQE